MKIAFENHSHSLSIFPLAEEKQFGFYEMEKFLERMEDSIKCFFTIGNRNCYNARKGQKEYAEHKAYLDREEGKLALEEQRMQEKKYKETQKGFERLRQKWGF